MFELDALTLEGLGNGAAVELFQNALQRVLENIQDPNTVAEATRKVVLTVEIKPNKNRRGAAVKYHVKETLASAEPMETTLLLGVVNGVAVASEYNGDPRQMRIEEFIEQGSGKITPISKKEEASHA